LPSDPAAGDDETTINRSFDRWTGVITKPIVEAVMIGVEDGQGISFVCPFREIAE